MNFGKYQFAATRCSALKILYIIENRMYTVKQPGVAAKKEARHRARGRLPRSVGLRVRRSAMAPKEPGKLG